MADKPLKMEGNQRPPENEAAVPPLELVEEEVVTAPPVPDSAPEFESSLWPIERTLSNNQLEEKIPRLVKLLESDLPNNLRDKGRKLKAHLQACQKEFERRKLPRNEGECSRTTD